MDLILPHILLCIKEAELRPCALVLPDYFLLIFVLCVSDNNRLKFCNLNQLSFLLLECSVPPIFLLGPRVSCHTSNLCNPCRVMAFPEMGQRSEFWLQLNNQHLSTPCTDICYIFLNGGTSVKCGASPQELFLL